MNPANLLVTEAPPAPPMPADAPLPVQPISSGSDKLFGKIMDRTMADGSGNRATKKDPQESADKQKTADAVCAGLASGTVSMPVVPPDLPIQGEAVATVDANRQNAALVTAPATADSSSAVSLVAPFTSYAPLLSGQGSTSAEGAPSSLSKGLPSAPPMSRMQAGADLRATPPSKLPQASADQSLNDSHPVEAESATGTPMSQPLETQIPQVAATIETQPAESTQSDGTAIAKQDNSMKKDVKADKYSASAEKILPRGDFSTIPKVESARPSNARGGFSETSGEFTEPARSPSVPREKQDMAYGAAVTGFKHFDTSLLAEDTRVESVQAPQMEKTSAAISDQVVIFRKIGAESMNAVLRPDSGTEISLHLSTATNGQVEVVARVERGNFEGLQAHWGELQSTLAQQGIRVSQLHQSSLQNHQAPFQNSSSQLGGAMGEQRQAQGRASRSSETPEKELLTGSMRGSTQSRRTTTLSTQSRGWEKWA